MILPGCDDGQADELADLTLRLSDLRQEVRELAREAASILDERPAARRSYTKGRRYREWARSGHDFGETERIPRSLDVRDPSWIDGWYR